MANTSRASPSQSPLNGESEVHRVMLHSATPLLTHPADPVPRLNGIGAVEAGQAVAFGAFHGFQQPPDGQVVQGIETDVPGDIGHAVVGRNKLPLGGKINAVVTGVA